MRLFIVKELQMTETYYNDLHIVYIDTCPIFFKSLYFAQCLEENEKVKKHFFKQKCFFFFLKRLI